MLIRIYLLILLLTVNACSFFKNQNLQDKSIQDLITSLQGTGEGKGRLGINRQQYLFSFDALLNENKDWILAANIPLHGEEVLKLQNLSEEKVEEAMKDGLEIRIQHGLSEYFNSQTKAPQLGKTFLLELRRIMRLVLHKKLNLEVFCTKTECRIGEAIYQVEATSKQLSLKKSLSEDYEIEFIAMNLTGPIFQRNNVFLHSKNKSSPVPTLLSLELFWK